MRAVARFAAGVERGAFVKQVLKLAKGLDLPVDAVTETFAFIARKGAGKSGE